MKKRIINLTNLLFTGILCLGLQSCCFLNKGELQNTFLLNDNDKSLLVYNQEDELTFVHSEGYEFLVHVFPDQGYYTDREYDDNRCQDYDRFEYVNATLRSELPFFKFRFTVVAHSSFDLAEPSLFLKEMEGAPDHYLNQFQVDFDQSVSLDIMGETFTDVYKFESQKENYYISTVFYSISLGVLKIDYLNGEYVQLQL